MRSLIEPEGLPTLSEQMKPKSDDLQCSKSIFFTHRFGLGGLPRHPISRGVPPPDHGGLQPRVVGSSRKAHRGVDWEVHCLRQLHLVFFCWEQMLVLCLGLTSAISLLLPAYCGWFVIEDTLKSLVIEDSEVELRICSPSRISSNSKNEKKKKGFQGFWES